MIIISLSNFFPIEFPRLHLLFSRFSTHLLDTFTSSIPSLPRYLHFLDTFTSSIPSLPRYLHLLDTFTSSIPSPPRYLHLLDTFTSSIPSLPRYLHLHFLDTFTSSIPSPPITQLPGFVPARNRHHQRLRLLRRGQPESMFQRTLVS